MLNRDILEADLLRGHKGRRKSKCSSILRRSHRNKKHQWGFFKELDGNLIIKYAMFQIFQYGTYVVYNRCEHFPIPGIVGCPLFILFISSHFLLGFSINSRKIEFKKIIDYRKLRYYYLLPTFFCNYAQNLVMNKIQEYLPYEKRERYH